MVVPGFERARATAVDAVRDHTTRLPAPWWSVSAQLRLIARGLVDYIAGIDPSAVGLVGALTILIRSRARRW